MVKVLTNVGNKTLHERQSGFNNIWHTTLSTEEAKCIPRRRKSCFKAWEAELFLSEGSGKATGDWEGVESHFPTQSSNAFVQCSQSRCLGNGKGDGF